MTLTEDQRKLLQMAIDTVNLLLKVNSEHRVREILRSYLEYNDEEIDRLMRLAKDYS